MSGLTRRSLVTLLALLLAPLAALHAADAVEPPTVPRACPWKSGTHKLMVDGVERTFAIEAPMQPKTGAALVMAFHGYGESPQAIPSYRPQFPTPDGPIEIQWNKAGEKLG